MLTQNNKLVSRFDNQYFYGEGVGTYLIKLEDKILLFDLPTYSKEIEDHLMSFKKPIFALLSHGPCGISDGKIWQQRVGVKIYLSEADKDNEWLSLQPDVLFTNQDCPQFSYNLEVVSTPGHTPGSICLLEKSTKSLFTGDTFGGTLKGEVRDFFKNEGNGDLKERLKSCEKLLGYDFEIVFPFHYEMILKEARGRLEEFVHKYH